MLRLAYLLLVVAALLGCAQAPNGNASWVTQPTRDQHTSRFFPIALGPHAVDCNSCHGTSDSFKGFDCLGCHLQAPTTTAHAAVAGFAFANASCYGCHPDGNALGAINHTSRFPIAPGQIHAIGAPAVHVAGTIDCASCHTSGFSKQVDCTVCHDAADQALKHGGLIGAEPGNGAPIWTGVGAAPGGETANCLLCHAVGGVQRVATHAQSPAQTAGFPIAIGNHFQSCEQCHTARNPIAPRRNAEIDFAAANCAACHTQALDRIDTKHTAFSVNLTTPPATTATCLGCHANGGTVPGFAHPSFPISASAIHALGAPAVHATGTIGCASCHTPAAVAAAVSSGLGEYKKVDCTGCHTSASTQPLHVAVSDLPPTYASPDSGTFATTGLCLRCHADSTVPVSVSMAHVPPAPSHAPFLVAAGAGHYQKPCLQCHLGSRTDKPWATDFTQPQHCTGCHTEPKTSANHLGTSWPNYPGSYSYADAACTSCHPTGDIGPFDHTPNFPTTAADVHNSSVANCLDCHTSTTTPAIVTTIDCVGCHNNNTVAPLPVDVGGVDAKHSKPFAAVTIVGFGYTFDTTSPAARTATNGLCLKCHAGTIATPSWKNPLKFPISQHSSCMSITSGNHRVNQTVSGIPVCFNCHNTMNATAKPWGVNWAQAQCTPCHNNRTATCR